jgi:type IV secretory pathway VirB3-like protein
MNVGTGDTYTSATVVVVVVAHTLYAVVVGVVLAVTAVVSRSDISLAASVLRVRVRVGVRR